MLFILAVILALFNLGWAGLRLTESIYQLKQTPDLNTLGKIIQVWKNFLTLETYKT